jgi:hypothetical protein
MRIRTSPGPGFSRPKIGKDTQAAPDVTWAEALAERPWNGRCLGFTGLEPILTSADYRDWLLWGGESADEAWLPCSSGNFILRSSAL